MTRKLWLALPLLAVSVAAHAAGRDTVTKQAYIGPAVSSNTAASPNLITLPAAGTTLKNCITDVSLWSEQNNTVRFLDGGTTSYVLANTTNTVNGFTLPDDRAICGSVNTAFYISFSTITLPVTATKQWFFSYQGYIK